MFLVIDDHVMMLITLTLMISDNDNNNFKYDHPICNPISSVELEAEGKVKHIER